MRHLQLIPLLAVLAAGPALASETCTAPQDQWRLEGPEGIVSFKPNGPIQTNSSEVVREGVLAVAN